MCSKFLKPIPNLSFSHISHLLNAMNLHNVLNSQCSIFPFDSYSHVLMNKSIICKLSHTIQRYVFWFFSLSPTLSLFGMVQWYTYAYITDKQTCPVSSTANLPPCNCLQYVFVCEIFPSILTTRRLTRKYAYKISIRLSFQKWSFVHQVFINSPEFLGQQAFDHFVKFY